MESQDRGSSMSWWRLPSAIWIWAWLLVTIQPLSAAEIRAPERIAGVKVVDAGGVLELAQKYPDLTVIDARMRLDRRQGYLQGSISLPDVETDCDSLAAVIPSQSHPVLFYCNGIHCGRSAVSARIAVGCGYHRVYWFRGGFEEWKAARLPYVKYRE